MKRGYVFIDPISGNEMRIVEESHTRVLITVGGESFYLPSREDVATILGGIRVIADSVFLNTPERKEKEED